VSSLDDHIRSVLDRIRVTLSGQLEADLTASTADILRAVADEKRQVVADAEERVAGEARLDSEDQLAVARADFDREREVLQQGATAEIEGLERTLGETRDELAVARNELEDLRIQLDQTTRLTSAFRSLNDASSLGDVLDRLAHAACRESGRTAVFLMNDGKLRGWRALGFEAGDAIVGAELDTHDSGVVGEAARLGADQRRNGDGAGLPPFAAADDARDAAALPVQVGGSVIAVLYADTLGADRPEEPEWLETLGALVKHAGRVLEAMTVNQAAALWTPHADAKRSRGGGDRSSVGMQ
jgi:hypothetical protein